MDNFIRCIFYSGCYRRLASLIAIIYCTLITIPQIGLGFTGDNESRINELLLEADLGVMDGVREKFDLIETSIHSSENSIKASREFLLSFIAQINNRYGLSLTPQESSNLVKNNMHLLLLSAEQKASILMAVDFLEQGHSTIVVKLQETFTEPRHSNANRLFNHLYWPWEWNWFGWNKNKKSRDEEEDLSKYAITKEVEVELPGNCYVGACEAFAGALLCIIPHPAAWYVGTGLIVDGGRRVVDGIIQLSDERRLDPNYKSPCPPF